MGTDGHTVSALLNAGEVDEGGRGREARGGITGEKKGRRGRSYICLPP